MPRSDRKIILAVCVAATLLVGATSLMPASVYSSWQWLAFWCVVGACLLWGMAVTRLWRRPLLFALHLSFLLMLAGGGASALTAVSGSLHLSPGRTMDTFVSDTGETRPLPCRLTLKEFRTEYYPGMTIPRDFRSLLVSDGKSIEISMNRPADIKGYRLYQTSFDGKGGSILTVRSDFWGTLLSFCGYALFAVSGFIFLLRRLRPALWLAPIFLAAVPAAAAPAVPDSTAAALEARQVEFRGRIVPYSTVAREFTLKLTGSSSVAGLSAERFLASVILYPAEWSQERFIYVKSEPLRDALGMRSHYISPVELYEEGAYRPAALYQGGSGPLDDAVLRLDEKVALFAEACEGRLFTPLPFDSGSLRPQASIRAEVLYNHIQPLRLYFILSLVCGIIAIALACKRIPRLLLPLSVTVALTGTAVYIWAWWVNGSMPLSVAPQIMQFLSVAIALLTLLIGRRDSAVTAIGLLMSGFTALVAYLSYKDPVMSPLMPVLASPWLTIHVSIVMTAYAMLAFTMPLAIAGLIKPAHRWLGLARRLLAPGVYLLGLGIFTGAVWAEQSWGRYWAWDPKETWALVTMLLYALPLHRSLAPASRPRLFCALLLLAFASILMTYIGVNYLPSLHAYQ